MVLIIIKYKVRPAVAFIQTATPTEKPTNTGLKVVHPEDE